MTPVRLHWLVWGRIALQMLSAWGYGNCCLEKLPPPCWLILQQLHPSFPTEVGSKCPSSPHSQQHRNSSLPTVKAQVKEVPKSKVILHDGHERRHLAEKQHAVISCSQFGQNTIQQLELSRGPIQLSPEPKNAKQEDGITVVFWQDPVWLCLSQNASCIVNNT